MNAFTTTVTTYLWSAIRAAKTHRARVLQGRQGPIQASRASARGKVLERRAANLTVVVMHHDEDLKQALK